MIHIHEIRIGNYALCEINRGGKISTEPCRVNLGMFAYCAEFGLDEFDCEPIPITPEILAKAGLNKIADDEFRKGRLVFQLARYESGYLVNVFIDGSLLGNYEHLHQLQNLYFALTGEELNVTL